MELKDIYDIWDKFENSVVCAMEIDFRGTHIKLDKFAGMPSAKEYSNNNSYIKNNYSDLKIENNNEVKIDDKESNKEDNTGKNEVSIKAPLVGTFYRASGEGEEPFVKEGDLVKPGDVIGIIEAMKLMNEIKADRGGVVKEIKVENATMVEFDQVILTLE